jgi:uncharacterized membrane protein
MVPKEESQEFRFEKEVVIHQPLETVYSFCAQYENLPRIMNNLKSVRSIGESRTHWVMKGPDSIVIEWDAVTMTEPNEAISWRSIEGSEIKTTGAILLKSIGNKRATSLTLKLYYAPAFSEFPGIFSELFNSETSRQLEAGLEQFRNRIESLGTVNENIANAA